VLEPPQPAAPAQPEGVALGNLSVDFATYRVWIDEDYVALGNREFALLSLFCSSPDQILPYNVLTAAAFKATGGRTLRHLNVVIHRLRAKLSRSYPYVIHTVRNRGYGLVHARGLHPAPNH